MKKYILFLVAVLMGVMAFSQANENPSDVYKKIYTIVITKAGEVRHVVKQGGQISTKLNGKNISGRWYFKAFPDVVLVKTKNGEVAGEIELNKEEPLRIVTPQPKGRVSIGVGGSVGGVSVSNLGPNFQSFNMDKYKAEITERMETKEEKLRREYNERKEEERQLKVAAKQAKKAARKNK